MKVEIGMNVWNKVYGDGKVVYIYGRTIVVKFVTVIDYVHTTRDRLHIQG